MYISIKQCDKLDGICNRFEVGLRSFVSDKLTAHYSEEDFKNNLVSIGKQLSKTTSTIPMHMSKYSAKSFYLARNDIYFKLKNSVMSLNAQDIVPGDVVTVGELTDLIFLFYSPVFTDLGKKFNSIEEYSDILTAYHRVRNKLSHIASARIYYSEVEKVCALIKNSLNFISSKYFWYCSISDINKLIIELVENISQGSSIKHNFDETPIRHNKLILREKELKKISSLIVGESRFGRVSGSVELHGYGGVGKTALALEFCYDIMRKELNGEGRGYSFILWLTTKQEELTYNRLTGSIYIKKLGPTYKSSEDVMRNLKNILGEHEGDMFQYINDNNIKGIIVLDNLETLQSREKRNIEELIRKFPRSVQFIITSRNYEGITEDNILIEGFSDVKEGKRFVKEYLLSKEFDAKLKESLIDNFISSSFGNTLIIVLGLDRLIEGTVSLEILVEELQVHKESDLEIVVDFMYKNTFDSAISEIENDRFGIDLRKFFAIMLYYKEPIDFHSMRELLEYDDSRKLETVIDRLAAKYVIIKTRGYFELHEFSGKFVILKMLPDDIALKQIQRKIFDHKSTIKDSLKQLYEDKKNYAELQPILDDWKPETEAEIIAIAQAYTEYKKVYTLIRVANAGEYEVIIKNTQSKFKNIEKRSHHPYIKHQKALILRKIDREGTAKNRIEKSISDELEREIKNAYEEAYSLINFRHKHIMRTESYPSMLWLYGIFLSEKGYMLEALRVLEESVDCFSMLSNIRNKNNYASACILLANVYCQAFLVNQEQKYLDRIKGSVITAREVLRKDGKPYYFSAQLNLLMTFADVFLGVYEKRKVIEVIRKIDKIPHQLDNIVNEIKKKAMIM